MAKTNRVVKVLKKGFNKGGVAIRGAAKNFYEDRFTHKGQMARQKRQYKLTESQVKLAQQRANLAEANARIQRANAKSTRSKPQESHFDIGGVIGTTGMSVGDPFEAMGIGSGPRMKKGKRAKYDYNNLLK